MTNRAVPTLAARIARAMEQKKFQLDKRDGEINIVYIKGMSADGSPNKNDPNKFDDLPTVIRFLGGVLEIVKAWEAATEPGRYFEENSLSTKGPPVTQS